MFLRKLSAIGLFALFLTMAREAQAAQLGDATIYNLFAFGNVTLSNTDAEGRVAVGGNAIFSNYGVASQLSGANGTATLQTGGSLNWNNGQLFNGNGTYGGSANLNGVGTPNGTISKANPSVDFAAAKSQLQAQSVFLGSYASNGTVASNYGVVTLTGSNASLNVFTITKAQFEGANTLNINVPTSSTTIINVQGTSVTFFSGQTFINGVADFRNAYNAKMLFNFYQASTLTNNNTGVNGSVLAPFAAANFGYSQLNGTLIVDSYVGTGELHWKASGGGTLQFLGDLPTGSGNSAVPEPGVLSLLASGGVFVGSCVLRRRKK